VRYLALAIHYCSWTLPHESNLQVYSEYFEAMNGESSTMLLDTLAFEVAFKLRGDADNLPPEMTGRAQSCAARWRQQLKAKDADVLRIHQRTLELMNETLSVQAQSQAMLVAELQTLLISEAREDAAPPRLGAMRTVLFRIPPPAGHREGEDPGHPAFSSQEAVAYYLSHALAHRNAQSEAQPAPQTLEPEAPFVPIDMELFSDIKSKVQVFSPAEAFAVLRALPPPSPHEGNNQQRSVLERMAQESGWRELTEVPEGEPLAELYRNFPHFKDVLDLVARSLAMAACGDSGSPVRVPPVLLRGAPGVGKTYFAQELARVMGTFFVEKDLSVLSEAFVLSGMDPSWKGSKPGVVFDAVVGGNAANPVICLNEVDKAKMTGTNQSPLAALYALLEPTSAERYCDEYLPVTFNASNIIWVLTANDGHIPEPLLHRLEVFDIPQPSQAQCQSVAQSVWEAVCRKTLPSGHGYSTELPVELLTVVSAANPRNMRKMLTRAVGQAAFCGRKHLLRADLTVGNSTAISLSRSIGFLTP
jgi:ATP-dependent Lon protease